MERNLIEYAKYAFDEPEFCALDVYGKPILINNIIGQLSTDYTDKEALNFARCVIELMEEK